MLKSLSFSPFTTSPVLESRTTTLVSTSSPLTFSTNPLCWSDCTCAVCAAPFAACAELCAKPACAPGAISASAAIPATSLRIHPAIYFLSATISRIRQLRCLLKPEPRQEIELPAWRRFRSLVRKWVKPTFVSTLEYCTVLKTLLDVARNSTLRVSPSCMVLESDMLLEIVPGPGIELRAAVP